MYGVFIFLNMLLIQGGKNSSLYFLFEKNVMGYLQLWRAAIFIIINQSTESE